MNTLTGKRAIVTGGASGIGLATAILLAQEGAAVSVVDINATQGEIAVKEINTSGGKAVFILADVSVAADCQRAVQITVKQLGGLDILFNNAGIVRRADVVNLPESDWDLVMAVNVRSIFLMSKYAVPEMMKAGSGSIINTGSGWGLRGGRNAVSYCASKGAVVNMTRAMAIDYGQQKIRVNCICPGDTDTAMLRDEASQLGQPIDQFLAEAADRPLRRYAHPMEIAQAVLFLASDASSYVTGAILAVDGGGTA